MSGPFRQTVCNIVLLYSYMSWNPVKVKSVFMMHVICDFEYLRDNVMVIGGKISPVIQDSDNVFTVNEKVDIGCKFIYTSGYPAGLGPEEVQRFGLVLNCFFVGLIFFVRFIHCWLDIAHCGSARNIRFWNFGCFFLFF